MKKVLVVISAIDLKYRYGCTTHWWQLLKALYEEGCEVILTPYHGYGVESMWWQAYQNPCYWEGESIWRLKNFVNSFKKPIKQPATSTVEHKTADLTPTFSEKIMLSLIRRWITEKWIVHVNKILEKEKCDSVLLLTPPLNHFRGFPTAIRQKFQIPVVYYDGDVPASLPTFSGFGTGFRIYQDSDPAEFDGFICNSAGGVKDIEELGGRNVMHLMWGADPNLCYPVDVAHNYDVSFYGYGYDYRQDWIEKMMVGPSRSMENVRFALGGNRFGGLDTGNISLVGDVPFGAFRDFCCASKINLNIARGAHTLVDGSFSGRLFELAAFGCCTVCNPTLGLDKWFEIGKEVFVVNDEKEAVETYTEILKSEAWQKEIKESVRKRLLEEHTYRHRAKQLISYLSSL